MSRWITNENREKSILRFTVIPSTEVDHYRRLGWGGVQKERGGKKRRNENRRGIGVRKE